LRQEQLICPDPQQDGEAMHRFDNKETRRIDCQLIVAPQYGITREAPRNQRKNAFLERRKVLLETRKVLRERRNLKLLKGGEGEVPIVES
jgi:hypothetical protein